MTTYKGYEGVVEFDEDAGLFVGEVINTRDAITFQGSSVQKPTKAFHASIDDYLEFCASRNEEPEKPFSGTLSLRLTPKMHRQLALEARRTEKSLNAYLVQRLQPKTLGAG